MEGVERRERYVSTDVTGDVSNRGKRSLSDVAQMSFSFKKKHRERLTTDVRQRTKRRYIGWPREGGQGRLFFHQCGEVWSGGGRGGWPSALLRVFWRRARLIEISLSRVGGHRWIHIF